MHSGFSVHNAVTLAPGDHQAEALTRYMMRPPVSLARLVVSGESQVLHFPKGSIARAARKRWADLLRRVYEVDPLVCPRCASTMRVVGFITQPHVITRILDHLRQSQKTRPRPPPGVRQQPSPAL